MTCPYLLNMSTKKLQCIPQSVQETQLLVNVDAAIMY